MPQETPQTGPSDFSDSSDTAPELTNVQPSPDSSQVDDAADFEQEPFEPLIQSELEEESLGADQSAELPMSPPSEDDPPQSVAESAGSEQDSQACIVRYGAMGMTGRFRHNLSVEPRRGLKVVIRTDRGVELGEVVNPIADRQECSDCRKCITPSALNQFLRDSGPEYPFYRDGKILRLANPQDITDQRHLDAGSREEMTFCRQQARQIKLPMKIVTLEHMLGGERIIFYFTSESRVDFRDLVRLLAAQFRTRIEMRQVGARDEARLVGDYERCGQQCCCQGFLKDLKPVSMRMAKTQKATLDPSKISGRCGRLMCCLRYEDEGYEDLKKRLPKKAIWVRTAAGVVGRVFDTQILTQLVRLWLPDNTQIAVPNEEIVERNVEPPVIAPPPERPRREVKVKGPSRMLRDETEEAAAAAATAPTAEATEPAPSAQSGADAPEARQEARQEGRGRRGRRGRGEPSGNGNGGNGARPAMDRPADSAGSGQAAQHPAAQLPGDGPDDDNEPDDGIDQTQELATDAPAGAASNSGDGQDNTGKKRRRSRRRRRGRGGNRPAGEGNTPPPPTPQ